MAITLKMSVLFDVWKFNIGKKNKGYNNKILVSNIDMKIGLNKDINKDHRKLSSDESKAYLFW